MVVQEVGPANGNSVKTSEPHNDPVPVLSQGLPSTLDNEYREEKPVPEQQGELSDPDTEPPSESPPGPITEVYSVFTVTQKRCIILTGSLASFFSPLSSSIYFPALDTIANDLHVSSTQISLTVTTYLIIQGLAPMLIAGFSDSAGRRPAYVICFVIYIAANLGLSLQSSYAALMVLRCIQSAGSSGTVALANGIVGDLVTSEERGNYVAWASLGSMLGPSVSPIIGGLLNYLRHRKRAKAGITIDITKQQELRKNYGVRFPNPLSTLVVVAHKESGLVLFACGLGLTCYYAISTAASKQFSSTYGFNDLLVGLIFLPIGAGSILSAFTTGRLVDVNYRRHAKIHKLPLAKNIQQDLSKFPIEQARLQIAIPLMWLGALSVIAYGWIMDHKVSIAGPIILLFVLGYALVGANQVLNILMVDIYPGKPATATAANNLVRCELGAAATAAIVPMINAMGAGWSFTLLALIFLASSPTLFIIMAYGIRWRQEQRVKDDKKETRLAAAGKK